MALSSHCIFFSLSLELLMGYLIFSRLSTITGSSSRKLAPGLFLGVPCWEIMFSVLWFYFKLYVYLSHVLNVMYIFISSVS